eukprot:NODE_894_length_3356_cov_0.184219.p1 type:complete len:475 gc:universal NODE_894_length_3356_cov_0.184219:1818-394(-)
MVSDLFFILTYWNFKAMSSKTSEDFVKSYLIRLKLFNTLQSFQDEFNAMEDKPPVCLLESNVYEQLLMVEKKMQEVEESYHLNTAKMKENDKIYLEMRKERDVFKTHHVQLMYEKKKSDSEIKKLRDVLEKMQISLDDMQKKVIKHDRDRLNSQRELENFRIKTRLDIQKFPTLPNTVNKTPISEFKEETNNVYIPKTRRRVWKQVKAVKAHEFEINQLIYDEKIKKFFTFSDDKTWKMFNSGLQLESTGTGHDAHITCGSLFSDDSDSVLFSADSLGILKVWNISNSQCVHSFKPSQSEIWTMNTNSCNLIFGKNNSASLWDINSLATVKDFNVHTAAISYINFLNENVFFSCGIDKKVILQDIRAAFPIQVIPHKYPVLTATVHGTSMLTADGSGNAFKYDLRYLNEMLVGVIPAKLVQSIDFGESAIHQCIFRPTPSNDIDFNPSTRNLDNPDVIYVACNDGCVYSYVYLI